ncbi:MAG: hypothetical protein A2283_05990, partial [Lentisphaerae bacterium RIFOXYA12_FULL_48_11]
AGLADYAAINGVKVVRLDEVIDTLSDKCEFPIRSMKKDDVAYIMFTSGSTGVPKGVPMTHENYINFINNSMDILQFKQGDVFSDYHDWAFDISIFYLFCCPLAGGIFAPVDSKEDKLIPLRFMQEHKVTVWSSVPSCIFRMQRLYPAQVPGTAIRIMFLCGEPFSLKVLKYCQDVMKVENIYNFYGLTETGVENFYHHCLLGDVERYEKYGFVPIGLPLPGNHVFLSEEKELLLAGMQLTPGYIGGVGRDKFETIDNERWYHTGDVVVKADDVYFCKGRIDSQVKISGYRIELMDIEANIKRFPGVREAVCIVRGDADVRQIIGVVLPEQDEVDLEGLRKFLVGQLPAYMIPRQFNVVKEFPVNQNGKIDRMSLRAMFV